jgi:hypothetical protein
VGDARRQWMRRPNAPCHGQRALRIKVTSAWVLVYPGGRLGRT